MAWFIFILPQEEYSNINECYKLKIILNLSYFGPEIAVYKTKNLRILTKLVFLLSLILLPNGTCFIIKNYMIEKRIEMRML